MNELQQLGYQQGEVTKNTFIYIDKDGRLSGTEKGDVNALPADYHSDGFYPSAIWIDSAGMSMDKAFNKGKL